jgi:hypothetical protein
VAKPDGPVPKVASLLWLVLCVFTALFGIALLTGVVTDNTVAAEAFGFALIVIAVGALVPQSIVIRRNG